MTAVRTIKLPNGRRIPVFGMGTWRMGESNRNRQTEIAALRRGMELGVSLIDTAEMYGEGEAEKVIGEALAGTSLRSEVFLVSKVYPHNASRQGVVAACDRTLKRLNTDYLDLHLLHWRSSVPLSETLEAFQSLKQAGKIRDYGVSNFDVDDMKEAVELEGGDLIATNQILYNLSRRGVELNLLPWCRQNQIPVMAYSPIEQGRLLGSQALERIAQARGLTEAQIAIAWLLHQDNIIVIPKASKIEHIEQNYAALDISLSTEELTALDTAFPPLHQPIPLEML